MLYHFIEKVRRKAVLRYRTFPGGKKIPAVLLISAAFFAFPVLSGRENTDILVSSADRRSGGIHLLRLTPEKKLISKTFAPLASTGYMALSPDGKLLYAVGKKNKKDVIAVFALPELKLLGSFPSGGRTSCHLTVSPDGRWLYTANYSSSSITQMPLDDAGLPVISRRKIFKLSGSGPHPRRQKASHPHWVGFDSSRKYLAVADLGSDLLLSFPFSPDGGISDEGVSKTPAAAPGAGPRHLTFSSCGKFAAAVNELDNTAALYRWNSGKFSLIKSISSRAGKTAAAASFAGAIKNIPSADGSFCFAVTNRGDDTIAFFTVDRENNLKMTGSISSGGVYPSDILPPGSGEILVSNLKSGSIRIISFDRQSGRRQLEDGEFSLPMPSCLLKYSR